MTESLKEEKTKSDRVDNLGGGVLKANDSRESQRDPPQIKDESKLKKKDG